MNSLRVVIASMPRMLAEIVNSILSAQPDIEVIGPLADDIDPLPLFDRTRPAALVLGHDDATLPHTARPILNRFPWLTVLSIRQDGHQGWIHRLVPTCEPVRELSPENLVSTLRSHVHRDPWEGPISE